MGDPEPTALVIGYAAQTFGLVHTTASNAGFITGLFGYRPAGDRLTAISWVGAGVMLVAVLTVEAVPLLGRRGTERVQPAATAPRRNS